MNPIDLYDALDKLAAFDTDDANQKYIVPIEIKGTAIALVNAMPEPTRAEFLGEWVRQRHLTEHAREYVGGSETSARASLQELEREGISVPASVWNAVSSVELDAVTEEVESDAK